MVTGYSLVDLARKPELGACPIEPPWRLQLRWVFYKRLRAACYARARFCLSLSEAFHAGRSRPPAVCGFFESSTDYKVLQILLFSKREWVYSKHVWNKPIHPTIHPLPPGHCFRIVSDRLTRIVSTRRSYVCRWLRPRRASYGNSSKDYGNYIYYNPKSVDFVKLVSLFYPYPLIWAG